MRILKIKPLSIICVFIILLMPCCNAVTSNVTIPKFEKEDFSIKIEEVINSLDENNSLYKLLLMLRLVRITIVTIAAYIIIDKTPGGNILLEFFLDGAITLIYSYRANALIRKILN